jgi:hypothetical protein
MIRLAETTEDRFAKLVRSFHSLLPSGFMDVNDLRALDEWAYSQDPDGMDGVKDAAAFVLNCWSTYTEWKCGSFDMFAAMRVWDDYQKRAFQAWVAAPWRP